MTSQIDKTNEEYDIFTQEAYFKMVCKLHDYLRRNIKTPKTGFAILMALVGVMIEQYDDEDDEMRNFAIDVLKDLQKKK